MSKINTTDEISQDELMASVGESSILYEVEEFREAVDEVVSETSISEKVEVLRTTIDGLSTEMQGWRSWNSTSYIEALDGVKKQVNDIEIEWNDSSARMKNQSEKLDTLLQSFPGAIETSTIRAMSLRLTHLEKLVSEIVEESRSDTNASRSKKMFVVSVSSLCITIFLWTIWITLNIAG